jgi:hypothetical protein
MTVFSVCVVYSIEDLPIILALWDRLLFGS